MENDNVTVRQLSLIRRVYEHAKGLSRTPVSPFHGLLSVIQFDWAIETMVRWSIRELGGKEGKSEGFQSLLTQCDKLLKHHNKGPLEETTRALAVRRTRNLAQHGGRYPTSDELMTCRIYTGDFLKALCKQASGVAFEELSMAVLIRNATARGFLSDAEAANLADDPVVAAAGAAAAVTWAVNSTKRFFLGSALNWIDGLAVMKGQELGDMFRAKEALDALERTRDVVTLLSLGIRPNEYVRFQMLAPRVVFMEGGKPYFTQTHASGTVGREQAEWMVHFAVETVLEVEERVSDIERPFGLEYPQSWRL